MISLGDQRGFAAIESLATTVFCLVALVGGLTLSYVSFARVWLKRAAYESSVCLSTPETTHRCEKALRHSVANALPIGKIGNVLLSRYRHTTETRFDWSVSHFKLRMEDRRSLPLLGPLP